MPCDTNIQDVHFIEFMEVVSEVDELIQQLDLSHSIFGGDLNTSRERSSPQTAALKQFISDYNFIECIDLDIAGVPYMYIGPNSTFKIDHFIVSPDIGHLYSDHVVMHGLKQLMRSFYIIKMILKIDLKVFTLIMS